MHICRTVLDGADLLESHGSRLPQKCPKIASLDPPRRSKGKEGSLEHFVWKPQCLGGGNNDLKTCQKINVLPARNLPIVRSAVSILNSFLLRKTPLARNNKKTSKHQTELWTPSCTVVFNAARIRPCCVSTQCHLQSKGTGQVAVPETWATAGPSGPSIDTSSPSSHGIRSTTSGSRRRPRRITHQASPVGCGGGGAGCGGGGPCGPGSSARVPLGTSRTGRTWMLRMGSSGKSYDKRVSTTVGLACFSTSYFKLFQTALP